MERANRKLRRAAGFMGLLARVELLFFYAVGAAACAFGGWLLMAIARG
ncbi:hypothetical protein KRMM14A1259_29700 [Krasilnikovia sp. MM14-A1259]